MPEGERKLLGSSCLRQFAAVPKRWRGRQTAHDLVELAAFSHVQRTREQHLENRLQQLLAFGGRSRGIERIEADAAARCRPQSRNSEGFCQGSRLALGIDVERLVPEHG